MDQKENTLRFVILISCVVLFAFLATFAFTILWYYRKRVTLQKELEKRNLDRLEQERHRIANNLQHLLSPLFDNILLQLDQLTVTESKSNQLLSETRNLASASITQLRELAGILRPQRLASDGLAAALQDLCQAIQGIYNLAVYIEGDHIPRLSPEKETHIFRMAEEILQNTAIHAKASQVLLNFSFSDKNLTLMISDDGIGLDLPAVQKHGKALGLRIILSHAELLEAEILLDTKKGTGTTYLINIPLSQEPFT
jgi:signal transduction histidine kinase